MAEGDTPGFFHTEWQLATVVPRGWLVAAYNLTTKGTPLLLCVPEEVLNDVLGAQDAELVWPRTRVETAYAAKLFELGTGGPEEFDLTGLSARSVLIDRLPDRHAVVCGARSRSDGLKGEANASVFDLDTGRSVRAFTLGDGIGHLQAVEDGSMFVGYFDQGVEGALGWDPPLGASGLVRFDAQGMPTWSFPNAANLSPIDDCYALNATQAETWVYYYSDFSLVRFDALGQPDVAWNLGVQGAHALAVVGGYVALFGSYEDSRDCTLLRLSDHGRADEVYSFQLPLPPKTRIVARGSRFGALSGTRFILGDLAETVAALERTKI